ncbi:reticulon-4-like isoform X2 [Erpetoichthys calabaricus]|uniref:reticulon-4-like isoform X2 n=1 Tax=Erpetoichthys calabaricus TaxID=27687 RepID=UPI002234955C|nr:reticulon-4-like isoform X2 [Erpetoichthys calabaricus]
MDAYDNVSSTTDPEELGKVHEGESDEDDQQDDVEFGSDDEILDLVGKPSDSVTAAPDSTKSEIKPLIPAEPLEEPRHQEKKEEMLKPVAGEVATPPAPLAPSSSCLDETLFPSAPSEPLLHPFPESSVELPAQLLQPRDSAALTFEIAAPVSSLSPLHSPDSLEELCFSESPDQVYCFETEASVSQINKNLSSVLGEKVLFAEDNLESQTKKAGVSLDHDIVFGHSLEIQSASGISKDNELSAETTQQEDVLQKSPFDSLHACAMSELTEHTGTGFKSSGSNVGDISKREQTVDGAVESSQDTPLSTLGKINETSVPSLEKKGDTTVGFQGLLEESGNELKLSLVSTSNETPESPETISPAVPSPLIPEVKSSLATQPYVTFATFDPTQAFQSPLPSVEVFGRDVSVKEDSFLKDISDQMDAEPVMSHLQFKPVMPSTVVLSHVVEVTDDGTTIKICESPTPDIVQGACDSEQDLSTLKSGDDATVDLVQVSESIKELRDPFMNLADSPQETVGSVMPPSLPDILESPLSSGKVASGSSEGTPDSDICPVRKEHLDTITETLDASVIEGKTTIEAEVDISMKYETLNDITLGEHENVPAFGLDSQLTACDLVKEAQNMTSDTFYPSANVEENLIVDNMDTFLCITQEVVTLNVAASGDAKSSNVIGQQETWKLLQQDQSIVSDMEENVPIVTSSGFEIENEDDMLEEVKTLIQGSRESADEISPLKHAEEVKTSVYQELLPEEFEIIDPLPTKLTENANDFLEAMDKSEVAAISEQLMTQDAHTSSFKVAEEIANVHAFCAKKADDQFLELMPEEEKLESVQETKIIASKYLAEDKIPEVSAEAPWIATQISSVHSTTEELCQPVLLLRKEEDKAPAERTEVSKVDRSESLNGAVVDLLYWRDIKKTGIVFGASLFLLLSLTVCSIVSVISYLALALLSVTISFRIYKGVVQAIQKSDEGHPFKAYLESDVAVSEEFVHKYSDAALGRVNCALKELRHLFLVEDLVDSLKFAVLMWILTYVGALFNGLTLLILALISVFSIPVIYERHQAQIDHYLGLVNNQIKDIVAKIQAKIPGLKRKTE